MIRKEGSICTKKEKKRKEGIIVKFMSFCLC